jgi:hypothetical protein
MLPDVICCNDESQYLERGHFLLGYVFPERNTFDGHAKSGNEGILELTWAACTFVDAEGSGLELRWMVMKGSRYSDYALDN